MKNSRSAPRRTLSLFLSAVLFLFLPLRTAADTEEKKSSIRWIDQSVSASALRDAVELDIKSHTIGKGRCTTPQLLALYSASHGGNYSSYRKGDLVPLYERLESDDGGTGTIGNEKLLRYYTEAYRAVFGGFTGYYTETRCSSDGALLSEEKKYGLLLVSPIAAGYGYTHYDDFGAARSFGYRRSHLGHDLMGSVGTPVLAVEAGIVEECGWNRYGGWRIGIRSLDGKRYWYYAHLRKGHPYRDIFKGKQVAAGDVIGYLGMTGYSDKEDVNNISEPHLHLGLEIIMDPKEKDGNCQIWLDLYAITDFLSSHRAPVRQDGKEKAPLLLKYPEAFPD